MRSYKRQSIPNTGPILRCNSCTEKNRRQQAFSSAMSATGHIKEHSQNISPTESQSKTTSFRTTKNPMGLNPTELSFLPSLIISGAVYFLGEVTQRSQPTWLYLLFTSSSACSLHSGCSQHKDIWVQTPDASETCCLTAPLPLLCLISPPRHKSTA